MLIYSKEQLAAMSDFEVNKLIASLMITFRIESWTFNNNKDKVQFLDEKTDTCRVVDYCSNPSDIMPLAFEHDIAYIGCLGGAVHKIDSGFFCFEYDISFRDKNPLRAIACCLILVLQAAARPD